MKRNLIGDLGWGPHVDDYLKEGLSPAAIVERLRQDAAFMAKMEGAGYQTIRAGDIHIYTGRRITSLALLAGDVSEKDKAESSVTVAAAKESILSILALGKDWESVVRRGMSILDEDLERYEMEREQVMQLNTALPDDKKKALPPFPHDTMNSTRKAFLACMTTLDALRSDRKLEGIVRAQTVNLNQGISQAELHQILFDIGEELGLTRSKMLEAYTKALVKRQRKDRPIEAESRMPGEGKWQGRLPFVQKLEERLGIGQSSGASDAVAADGGTGPRGGGA